MSISGQGGNNNEIKDTYVDHNAQTSYQVVNTTLNNARYQQLLQLLNQNVMTSLAAEIPQPGISSHMCSYMTSIYVINNYTPHDWILDSGATDHITCFHNMLSQITTCDIDICLPNRCQTKVKLKDTVQLTIDIVLYDVLFVLIFQFNIISVDKLTSTLKCDVHFPSNIYIIQDSLQRKVKGIGKLHGHLYKLLLTAQNSNSSLLFHC